MQVHTSFLVIFCIMYVVCLLFYAIDGFFVCFYVDFVILFSSAPLFPKRRQINYTTYVYIILLLFPNDRLCQDLYGG